MSGSTRTQDQLKAALLAAQGGEQRTVSRTETPRSPRPGAPRHPIRSMQGPFEESIEEASNPPDTKAQENFNKLDPRKRRQRLLDTDSTNGTYNEQWRTRSTTAKFHPLTKIISQIAFGVHLLHQQLAKSDEEVVKILQKHVDDVDNFVQRAEEDLDLAINDIRERINYLKLPLEHTGVFDVMLDDKAFRNQIVDGNEKIEKVVDATAGLVKDLQVDVQKGMESTIDFGKYLDDISDNWPQNDRGSIEIFRTMQANVEGWVQCMSTLQMKGNGLSVAVVQLGSILSEMAKRAASASRREQRRAERAANGSGGNRSRTSSRHIDMHSVHKPERRRSHKPLPQDPDHVAQVMEAAVPGAKLPHRESSLDRSYKEPRQAPRPRAVAESVRSTKSAKSTKSGKSTKKPHPIHTEKMPALKKTDTSKSDTVTMKSFKMPDFANVFRFHGSAAPSAAASVAPSPLASPGLPPAGFSNSEAPSPMFTPRSSSLPMARKPVPVAKVPDEPVEMDAETTAVFELDSTPQATLEEARSRLRQAQSLEVLATSRLQSPVSEADKDAISPGPKEPADSAYASSPEPVVKYFSPPAVVEEGQANEGPSRVLEQRPQVVTIRPKSSEEQARAVKHFSPPSIVEPTDSRPTTSPSPRPPAIGALGIFPSSSMTSLPSMVAVEQDRQSDKMSITSLSVTALPSVSSPPLGTAMSKTSTTPREPSRLRHGSVPTVLPTLKKHTSLSALRKFFTRRSASAEPGNRVQVVDEGSISKSKEGEKDQQREKENKLPPVVEKKVVAADPVELPG